VANRNTVHARFEFRSFGEHAIDAFQRLERNDHEDRRAYSADTYCLSKVTDSSNVKIRNGQLDVKRLVEVDSGLERWKPIFKASLPVADVLLRSIVLPSLRAGTCTLNHSKYDQEAIRREVVEPHARLMWLPVRKRRWLFTLARCRAEFVELEAGGALLRSIAIEGPQSDEILDLRMRLGLSHFENVSYPRALKRLVCDGKASTWLTRRS